MNVLKMNIQQTILTLGRQGWSNRRIARELGVNRETVARYLKAEAKPAISTTGTIPCETSVAPSPAVISTPTANPATQTTAGVSGGRQSLCREHTDRIRCYLDDGLSAQRIFEHLVSEHGFPGSYESVKRFVRRLTAQTPIPFRRIECEPGEEMQVDFGQGAQVQEPESRYRPHLFRAVLSYSRRGYSEAVRRQNTDSFIHCLENAFRHFNGVPGRVVVDNLKAAVLQPDWYDPELNPKLLEFSRHYGFAVWPTKSYTPRHKGKVERAVGYAQNALKGRQFASLHEQNQFLLAWERNTADKRIHGTTKEQVLARFLNREKAALRALPPNLFPCFTEAKRKVHRDGHVDFQKSYYSVPPEYIGQEVWVRAELRVVRIFNQRLDQIAIHARCEKPGLRATDSVHIHAQRRSALDRGADYLLGRCRCLGTYTAQWADTVYSLRGIEGLRSLQGLLQLSKRHSSIQLDRAAEVACHRGEWRLRSLRRILYEDTHVVQMELVQSHPIIRDLSAYRVANFNSIP